MEGRLVTLNANKKWYQKAREWPKGKLSFTAWNRSLDQALPPVAWCMTSTILSTTRTG